MRDPSCALSGQIETSCSGLPGREPDDTSIDEAHTGCRHRLTDLDRALRCDRVRVHINSGKAGGKHIIRQRFSRVWGAYTDDDRALGTERRQSSRIPQTELLRPFACLLPASFRSPIDLAAAILRRRRDRDSHFSRVQNSDTLPHIPSYWISRKKTQKSQRCHLLADIFFHPAEYGFMPAFRSEERRVGKECRIRWWR